MSKKMDYFIVFANSHKNPSFPFDNPFFYKRIYTSFV